MRITGLTTALAATGALLLAGLVAPAPASAEPTVGACYDYTAAVLEGTSTPAPVVDCSTEHTAETYLVRPLPASFGLPSDASLAARLAAGRPCSVADMNAYLGTPERTLPSRFRPVVLFPTDAQWQAGERWVRCDVVLQAGEELKAFAGTAAALVAAADPRQFDYCTPREPNAKSTAAYACTKPKRNWIKVLDAELGKAGSAFPGASTVERKTRNLCERQGKKWAGKEKFPGWWAIWPTSVGWKEGRRSAQCFVPYQQYLKELQSRQPKPTPAPTPEPVPVPEPTPSATIDPPPPAV